MLVLFRVPGGALTCLTLFAKVKQVFFFILSFEFKFKILVITLLVHDWLYSGRSGRGLGLAVKTASPSCTGILASPKFTYQLFRFSYISRNASRNDIPSNVVGAPKLMLTYD